MTEKVTEKVYAEVSQKVYAKVVENVSAKVTAFVSEQAAFKCVPVSDMAESLKTSHGREESLIPLLFSH